MNVATKCKLRVGFAYRLYRLRPRASRSKGASNKLWYALSQWPVYNQSDQISSKIDVLIIIHEI